MIIDIIVLSILAICIFIGWKKGLIVTVFNFLSLIVSFFVSRLIYPDVARIFRSSGFIYDNLKDKIGGQLSAGIENSLATSNGIDENFFSSLHLPSFMTDALSKNYTENVSELLNTTKTNVQDYIGGFIANAIISVVAMIVTMIVIFIAMRLVGMLLKIITKLPVIKTIDKLSGALVGGVFGVLIVWTVLSVLVIFFSRGSTNWADSVDKSVVAKVLQEYNIIFNAIVGVIR